MLMRISGRIEPGAQRLARSAPGQRPLPGHWRGQIENAAPTDFALYLLWQILQTGSRF